MIEGRPIPANPEPESVAGDLPDFPVPSAPLADSHLRGPISWADYMDETAWHLQRYLEEHDDPAERVARKSEIRFSL
jgi:hypothetical protein